MWFVVGGLGFGFNFGVLGVGFVVWGLGFGVWGSGFGFGGLGIAFFGLQFDLWFGACACACVR